MVSKRSGHFANMAPSLRALSTSFSSVVSDTWSSPKLGSATTSPATSYGGGSWGGEDFSSKILQINNVIIESEQMPTDKWSDLAFALGVPATSETKICREATIFHQKMKNPSKLPRKAVINNLQPFFVTLLAPYEYLGHRTSREYHRDSAKVVEALEDTVLRLPTPRPAFSIGYKASSFTSLQHEFQQGVVATLEESPCDLGHLAQPVANHYWPFLVVEVSDTSLELARQSCAASAACCNNAFSILKHAASPPTRLYDTRPQLSAADAPRVFSLAIHDKSAALSVHTFNGDKFSMSTIQTYQLDDAPQMLALASRLQSIFVWGMHNRLKQVSELLDQLHYKVLKRCGWNSGGQNQVMIKTIPSTPSLPILEFAPADKQRMQVIGSPVRLPSWLWPFKKRR